MSVFLGISAPASANANLAAQILMGVALIVGMSLARRRMFRAHAVCQSAVVLLNLIPIALFMLPVFRRGVAPGLGAGLGDPFYAVSAAHAALGAAAELLGLYIILRAGTSFLPEALRFQNYKKWMRAELALWWLVIALGLGTYFVWYGAEAQPPATGATPAASSSVAPPATRATAAPAPSATPAVVAARNFSFEPKELTITEGTTVIWRNETGRHTAVADDDNFESPVMAAGGEFRHTFTRAGRFPYYCSLHGAAGGKDMAGVITVTPRGP